MQDIDLTAQKIVEQMNAGRTDEAAETLDKAYHSMPADEFRQVVETMERKARADSVEGLAAQSRAEVKPTVNVKNWIMYTPWQGNLFQSRPS